jgi:hypothetical protein
MKITRAKVNEAIMRLRKGYMTTNEEMNQLMDRALSHRCEYQTVAEWKDAVYYSEKEIDADEINETEPEETDMKVIFENWKSVTDNYDADIRVNQESGQLEMNDHEGQGWMSLSCYSPDEFEIDENGNGFILGIC